MYRYVLGCYVIPLRTYIDITGRQRVNVYLGLSRADFFGGVQGGAHNPSPKNRNWHRLQTFALWQSRFAFITQKSDQNVHKDLLTLKSIDAMCF